LAKQYKLPIVIHCRELFDDEILEEEKSADLFGIFFTGTYEQALQAISII
jgi:TatD DNase family protein